ncbi:acetyltransferase [Pseudomonas sp. CDFA 553]|uniref:acetyltransferase n=1 Tax=Pseudomonas quasicaspiana TaxID=2829821 RepID=UPI001E3DF95B|nr:acetyltransferase [Pseudomonas quasicaspiana]MCD5987011.1 acetyltransferase [Pseudomonas quasicaspiana]
MSDLRSELPLILLGAGGHAKVLLSVARSLNWSVIGVCDPQLFSSGVTRWRGLDVLGGDEALQRFDRDNFQVLNGIGQVVGSAARRKVYERLAADGYRFATVVHPAAWVDSSVELRDGVQVMAGAIIQADSVVGKNSIINTHSAVDHDCVVGAHSHIAPGATLCGGVSVGERCFVASGATVIQGIVIGNDAVIGAGSVLVRDVASHGIVLGSKPRFGTLADK